MKYIIGIDEVGRGPLAGPVAVGAVCIATQGYLSGNKKLHKLFPDARDSKKLTEQKREEIFTAIKKAEKAGGIRFAVQFESAHIIDTKGLSWAIRNCIRKCIKKLHIDDARPEDILVLLDGGLKAPAEYLQQKTIIRGDDSEIIISLASIAAKVTRDRHMKKISRIYPLYGFATHKGYGTVSHRRQIARNGLSKEHRKSFCRAFLQNIQK